MPLKCRCVSSVWLYSDDSFNLNSPFSRIILAIKSVSRGMTITKPVPACEVGWIVATFSVSITSVEDGLLHDSEITHEVFTGGMRAMMLALIQTE